MPALSLKIIQDEGMVTRKVKFDTRMTVKEAHKVVKEKVIVPDNGKEYALFLRSADNDMSGVWLDDDRTLDYYMLRDGDSLDYICRIRNLRVRLLDDTVKTLQVDEAKTVGDLMIGVCARIGITNHDEYGLCHDEVEETDDGKESNEPATGTLTLKRKNQPKERDLALEQLSKKLKTDDNVEWLDQHRTLREQGIDTKETLLLKRRLYFSDRNVDSRDPVQLNLLYVQTRDAILNGRHPVTEQQATEFAGIQCQIHFGDFQETKHKPGFLENLEEYLPEQYSNAWGAEKKILKAYSQHQGVNHLDAKFLYIKTARALPTYGVTFFLVKEKQKDKKKLVPRLLGINSEAILRLDEVTKEILQQWPLTHVKTYHAGKSQTFTLNFGDYSDKEYSVKTQDCHRIRDILEGYIDIIRRRMLAKPTTDPGESMVICQDNVQAGKSHLIQHVSNNPSKMSETWVVGPSRIMPSEQGSQAQSGAMLTTVQQIVVTDHLQNQQQALKGEIPLRGDMSKECIKALNRMNSNSVKISGLLTDPTDVHVRDAQKIVETMQGDLPVVQQGVKETAEKQTDDSAKKMLLDELQDLNNLMNKLAASTKPGQVNPNDAKDTAESIADLTTQMYFSIDPKTQRRSQLLRRSRKSFKAGEKTEQTIRRASFIAAATTAMHSVDNAAQALNEEYTGPKPDEAQRKKLEKSLEDRMGKLNAAIALYLTAHADPENIDYAATINSMNAINELMPKLARDTQMLASTKDPAARQELKDEMRKLFDATKKLCAMTGEDHEKMQQASNNYADIAGKLIFTFARGTNADKENEIIELAKTAGHRTSLLLVTANELTCQAANEPAAADVDEAGVRTATAARDLLACAQLTAPAIHEPHCQSALTAAAEGVSSSVHQMESTWRPLVEDPTRQHMSDQLHDRVVDVMKALERLKDSYGNLGDAGNADDASLPLKERQRLKFITTMTGAKNNLQGVEDTWNKSATGTPSEQERVQAQRRLEQKMAQLNAAVAALATATADRENPDFATAELAMATISELMPQIVKDTEIVSSDKDEATRNEMLKQVRALCDATREMCDGAGYQHGQGEAATNFGAASGKLLFLISPGADKGKEKHIMKLSAEACDKASELLSQAQHLREHVEPEAAAELSTRGARAADAAQALLSVSQVTAPSISSARCQDALGSAAARLRSTAGDLTAACQHHAQQQPHCDALMTTHQQLQDTLDKLSEACQAGPDGTGNAGQPSGQHEKQRLQFINSMPGAKRKLVVAEQQLTKPIACQMMTEEDAAALEQQLSQRLARLNAAVAALAAATADRENPDYAAAEQAVKTITELMPQVAQDSRKLCGTKSDSDQAAMLQHVRALCEATRDLCDGAGQPQGVGDAAAKFSAASGNLKFVVSPKAENAKEKQVVALSAVACGKASELLSQVQRLTEQIEPDAAAELDSRGARAADAAQALLTVAQVTASSIDEPHCQNELISAAQRLGNSAAELTSSCRPHLQQRPEMQQQVLSTQQQLDDSLSKLFNACKTAPAQYGTGHAGQPSGHHEKQRLQFINSMPGAKRKLVVAEQQLTKPIACQMMTEEDAAALEQQLSQRLARLNAAVAALAAATADRENPDYATAEQAVKTITELMPQVAQDSRKLCGTKSDGDQAAMLQHVRALCEATRDLCDGAGQPQGVGDAAAKFSAASGNLKFIVSPEAENAKEKQVVALSAAACGKASELLSQMQRLTEQIEPDAAAELDSRGARAADAAQALLTVAQVTASSIDEPHCQNELISAAQRLGNSAAELTSSCRPHLQQRPEMQQQVLSSQQQLDDSLSKLFNACKTAPAQYGTGNAGQPSGQHEKQRLQFINSMPGAKRKLVVAEQQLTKPIACQMMTDEDAAALEQQLSQRLARLNAAVAALAAATADRENPDYAAAEQAVKTITELMPQVAQDSRKLCGTKSDGDQAAMLQHVGALCEATRDLCDGAGQPQGVGDAAAKFSAASGNLKFVVSPKAENAKEKQVVALSAAACGKASELLSQVQRLTEQIEPDAAAELDSRGARAADAAQALLTVAQVTASSIDEPHCQNELISAAQRLGNSAAELTSSCRPHLQQRPEMQQQVLSTQQQLDDSLSKLYNACKTAPAQYDTSSGVSPAQREKQRLKFVSSASGAKNRLYDAEQQLKQPLACQLMKEEDAAALEQQLSQRLARLNAAVAALAAATADRENPDYIAAERATKDISELMPQVVQDSRKLCSTKDDAGHAAMLRDVKALCEASQEICDNAGQPQGLSDAAAKFSAASGKLVFVVSPKSQAQGHDAQGKQVIALSAAACGKASELLTQAQRLTEQVKDPTAAAELDTRGARAADAANALLTVAQVTASSISQPECSAQLTSSAEKLRTSAAELTSSCRPHLQQRPEMQQQVMSTQQQLDDSLNKLVNACKSAKHGNLDDASSPAQQEKQRLKFISSVSGAKNRLHAAEQQLKEPMVGQVKQEDAAALEQQLSQRLARLNAAVAALAAATADRENPDYAAADRAVKTITELMPHVVQDSRKLCSTKDGAGQAALLRDVKALCEASQEICDNAGQPQGLSDAAAKFSAASGKLVFVVSPKSQAQAHDAQEKQVMALSSAACGKTSELLTQVQRLTEQVQDPAAAAQLDTRGARAADAANALLTVAQVTASSISEPECSAQLTSSAEKLRTTAAELTSSCRPHLQQRPEMQQQVMSTQQQLDDSLNKLVNVCKSAQHGNLGDASPAQQEKQRLKFISSMSGAKNRLDAAEQQLKEPMVGQVKQEDAAALEQQLSQRLARLNAAVAALASATADRENPDYAAADRAVKTITELMPHVVQDSRKLCSTKEGADQAAMLRDTKALCEASRQIFDKAGQPQGLSEAAAKFSAASGKLVSVVSPKAHDAQEKQIVALSAAACGKTSELLTQVQRLTEQVQDPAAAAELDTRGARAADAANALLTVAQVTASSISEPECSAQLTSSAEKLRNSAAELTSSCRPHLEQRPEMQRQVLSTQQQLDDSLDKLLQTFQAGQQGNLTDTSSAQQEKQHLTFISSVSEAKNRLEAAEQHLKEPMVGQVKKEDAALLQNKLSQRLARLNAAVAALAAATADRENPDYTAADRAVKTITELMPHVVQDSRKLCSTKDDAGQAAMMHDIKTLCEATRGLCDNAIQPEGLSEAAAKFSAASGKLVFVVSPKAHDAQEKQVLDLSAVSCGKASDLLTQVQRLTEEVKDPAAAAELDSRGARAADAAQALLTVAQVTASSISEPGCSTALVSSAEKLRTSAAELTSSCRPHLQQRPEMQQQVMTTQKQLDDSLNDLVHVCKSAQQGTDVTLSPQQEQQRLKFLSNVSNAENSLDTVEQQMKEPILCQMMKEKDGVALQHQLSRRLVQLNAAVAALNAATSDGKNPDYPAAERAVIAINELLPQVVQDSRTLCGTKDEAGQAAMLRQLRALCEASRDISDSAGHPRKLIEASAKLANASDKLLFVVSPEQSKQQIVDASSPGSKPALPGKKPPVPVRDPKHTIAQAVPASSKTKPTADFLDALRCEESQDKELKITGVDAQSLGAGTKAVTCAQKQYSALIDEAEKELNTAEEGLKKLYISDSITVPGTIPAVEVAKREQHMEDTLARAGVELASLVASNYADKLDYKAAMGPTIALKKSVKSIVDDGSVISGAFSKNDRKPFLDDLTRLCQATKNICEAARSKKEKLNDAAISFGDTSAKLLRVVSSDVNPTLEKEVISRAKAIGDTASRLALEATNVASNSSNAQGEDNHVQDICTAGASCVDAAGKLVYTAKLVSPTIHHSICQDALVSSADSLSSSLTTFSSTWKPLASAQGPNVQKLTEEAKHLEELVERLRRDVKAGKLRKRRQVGRLVNVDTPLRQMTMQIIGTANNLAENGDISPELKKEYGNYSNRLAEAIRALDLANARYQRAPHDTNKRNEMDMAIQDLQVTLLQTRPSKAGQEQNNIVDFRDFLQDLVKEAYELQEAAKKNEGPAGKRTTEDIKLLCSKISEDASRLLNPTDEHGDGMTVMTSVDDIMDIDQFGQECDVLVKEIDTAIQGIQDQKVKQALRAKALPLTESCHLLRFATNSHISATKTVALDEALRDLENFKTTVMKPLANDAMKKNKKEKKTYVAPLGSAACERRASTSLLQATRRAAAGEPDQLLRAIAVYTTNSARDVEIVKQQENPIEENLRYVLQTTHNLSAPQVCELQQGEVKEISIMNPIDDMRTCLYETEGESQYSQHLSDVEYILDTMQCVTSAKCQKICNFDYQLMEDDDEFRTNEVLKVMNDLNNKIVGRKVEIQVLNPEDIDKLLLCERQKVEGTPKQLQDKVQQLSTKLSSTSGTVVLSVKKPESLARSLHAAADVAAQLANTARALKDNKRPVQCKRIEDAADDMCLATYSLMKTSELVCQDPNHHDSRRKVLEACHHLNDTINKLVRSVKPAGKVAQECGEVQRSLPLQRSVLQATPLPCGALPYAHCVDTLFSQRDVLQKLNSDQAMSREEFLKSMTYVASAVSNSTECAAQAAYLLSVSEKDESIGKEGIVDVSKLHKAVGVVEDTCVSIITANHEDQVEDQTKVLKSQVQELLESMDDGIKKTKDGDLKDMLKECRHDIDLSSKQLFSGIKQTMGDKQATISIVMNLMDDVNNAANLIEHPELVPTVSEVSADTQAKVDEVVKSSLALLTNTEDLIKQVKAAPEEPEVMKWVMFNKRKDVLDAFEALLKSIKSNGQRAKLLEGSMEDSEAEKKSYVQKQFDVASKWLLKPTVKAEIKSNGQQAVRNLIEVANKITEDLKGNEKEDMRHLVIETQQLLTECSKKYDHEQYSVLMERVRELKKGIERGVVTRVVEDFMEAEAPLADLDILAEHERDETKRKFLLEKKIAELLAHLGRVTKTARLIADTDGDTRTNVSTQLHSCSEQAELLAPKLVKAAEQRVAYPDNKAVIENYKNLLAKYAESLSKIRDLCDQSVDPMDFVQTAGETMQRMREESTKHNDPMQCANTSAAITKLANRVIHVGLSSSTARSDPELQRALSEAHQQLTAATPPSDTRASRMPDWKDTTAKILQATEEVESLLGGENIFRKQPGSDQPIYNEALNLHVAIRAWSSRDNEIVAVAKRMAVLMAKLSNFMNNDKQHDVLATSKSIVAESHEVARLAKKLAHECSDHRIKTNLLQTCERIPTISGQLKMLTTVKGTSLGRHGTQEDKEAMDMLVGNAQSLMLSIQDVVKGAASASVKINSQRGPRMKWVRKTIY